MAPEQLYQLLHRKPFAPLRVHLKDGRVYDIRHPHLAVVGKTYFQIGIPVLDQADPWADSTITVDLEDIARVEEIDSAQLASSVGRS